MHLEKVTLIAHFQMCYVMLTLVLELNYVNCMENSQSHVLVIVNRDAVTALVIVLQICSEQVDTC